EVGGYREPAQPVRQLGGLLVGGAHHEDLCGMVDHPPQRLVGDGGQLDHTTATPGDDGIVIVDHQRSWHQTAAAEAHRDRHGLGAVADHHHVPAQTCGPRERELTLQDAQGGDRDCQVHHGTGSETGDVECQRGVAVDVVLEHEQPDG